MLQRNSTSRHLPFNCNEGLSHWKVQLTAASHVFSNGSNGCSLQQASWPEAKKQWCCRCGSNQSKVQPEETSMWNMMFSWMPFHVILTDQFFMFDAISHHYIQCTVLSCYVFFCHDVCGLFSESL